MQITRINLISLFGLSAIQSYYLLLLNYQIILSGDVLYFVCSLGQEKKTKASSIWVHNIDVI